MIAEILSIRECTELSANGPETGHRRSYNESMALPVGHSFIL
jgi:hypothetical protein